MNILSLFDGISCGQQALKELGIPVEKYYASEIEKHPIAITKHNFPDTIQLGDVTKWREWDIDWASIDLLQGGSPCQGFSFAGKQLNFDDPRSKLFFEYVDILNHIKKHNPSVKFLLENVRMKKEYQDVISEHLGVQPMMINSALVSAQNRVRLYWQNIGTIEQPEDRGILLKDVLEEDHEIARGAVDRNQITRRGLERQVNIRKDEKSNCVVPTYAEKLNKGCIQVGEANLKGHDSIKRVYSPDGKSPTLTTMGGGHREPKVAIQQRPRGKNKGGIHTEKSPTLTANKWEDNNHVVVREKSKCVRSSGLGSYDRHEWDSVGDKGTELYWRKLTPTERERLQTLPDGFTSLGNYDGVIKKVANRNRYRALGNGWTVEVIKHIYSN